MNQDRERVRGVFAISVAAEMTSMQIQNLRVYERRGLLAPQRSDGGTRLYSRADIETLHRIRDLLADGLNLAGIARVLELEAEVARLRARLARPEGPGRR
ncbi:MerR family transcriptional regulator [Nocardioides sp. LHD-245]|uniref:MerR family transcriptional regulator n=1 Tax=Nocardioides sp. LHD-245 TaxID=3051387 RepID=UPI0027E17968|nr:MerR family transcriptional regulator [Nocardioides sp. LHD-245]